ncbi:hypothetical protein ACLOJK_012284 [Asimina triloba]
MLQSKQKMLPQAQLLRWANWFSQFTFEVKHIPGKNNVLADFLSKNQPLIAPITEQISFLPPEKLSLSTNHRRPATPVQNVGMVCQDRLVDDSAQFLLQPLHTGQNCHKTDTMDRQITGATRYKSYHMPEEPKPSDSSKLRWIGLTVRDKLAALQGNPICANAKQHNIDQFCEPQIGSEAEPGRSTNSCQVQCPTDVFYVPAPASYPVKCSCLAPIRVGYRLKSPGISYFPPYELSFENFLTSHLGLHLYQLAIGSYEWERGTRLRMYLMFFPAFDGTFISKFNDSEVIRIEDIFADWKIPNSDIFGPAELLNFTLLGPYKTGIYRSSKSGMRKVVVVGIVLGAVAGIIAISAIILIILMRRQARYYHKVSRRRLGSKFSIKIDGVKEFTFEEMASATKGFDESAQVGQGGYGKVYKGTLVDGTVVAIKRAQEGSLQGKKEFLTEIEFLSRLHHRNLVSLLGYCVEDEEQDMVSGRTIGNARESGGLYFF